jgi:hypothetical protein
VLSNVNSCTSDVFDVKEIIMDPFKKLETEGLLIRQFNKTDEEVLLIL